MLTRGLRLALVSCCLASGACRPDRPADPLSQLAACVSRGSGAALSIPTPGRTKADGLCSPLEQRARVAAMEAAADQAVDHMHRAGLAHLLAGEPRRGLYWLERVVADDGRRADAWSDLAAADLDVARSEGAADFVVRALDAALRALELAPDRAPAAANRDAALRFLGLGDPASGAGPSHDATASPDGDAGRDETAERVERQRLASWADHLLADRTTEADTTMRRALDEARALTDAGGDASVEAVARELTRAESSVPPRDRAVAWRGYLRALDAFESGDIAGTSTLFAPVEPALSRLGPSARARVRLMRATLDRVEGRTDLALAAVRPDLPEFSSFSVLDARRRWQRGLLLAEGGRLGEASGEYLRAQLLFHQAGEREGEAMVSSLLASGYADLEDWGLTWANQLRAQKLLVFCRRLRRESIRTTGALIASAMSLHRAASAIRQPAIVEAKDSGRPSNAAFLLADDAVDLARLERRADSLAALESARALATGLEDAGVKDMLEALIAFTHGTVDASSDPTAAEQQFARAVSLYRRRGSEFQTASALLQRGALLRSLGRPAEAEAAFRDGLRTTLTQAGSLQSVAARADLRAARWDLVRALAAVLIDRQDVWGAFDLVESVRAEPTGRPSQGIQPAPHGDVVLVSYLDLGTAIQAWATHGPTRQVFASKVSTATITADTERLRAHLQAGRFDSSEASRLFDVLLGPVRPLLRAGAALVICADGPLTRLPFGALRDGPSGSMLLERHAVVVSTDCRHVGRARPARAPVQVLVAGDPASAANGLPRLRRSREEATAIADAYPRSRLLLGEEVTPRRLSDLLPRADLFHFAGHAVAHPDRPGLSRLIVSTTPTDAAGVLYAADIAAMRLRTRTVVLAACDTAEGAARRGSGVLGLAQAFLAGGASEVVATQWAVPDADASRFFVEFHRRLRAGAPTAEAVRQTQMWARDQGLGAATWAAVTVVSAESGTSVVGASSVGTP